MLPFDAGGVTEMLGLGSWEEGGGPTESSEVFPAPLAHGLGVCDGPAGLWIDERWAEKRKRQNLINGNFELLQVVPFLSWCSPLFWFMRVGGKVMWGKELGALSICCTTEDSTQSWHHLGLTCMWRKRRGWKLWLQMMAEPFGGAAGTGFLWEEWLDRWMKDWIKGWMDG